MIIENKTGKVVVVAMNTGEQYIGTIVSNTDKEIVLSNPLSVYPVPDKENDRFTVSFIPPIPHVIEPQKGEYELTFNQHAITFLIYEKYINKQVLDAYNRGTTKMRSGLDIPPKPGLVTA